MYAKKRKQNVNKPLREKILSVARKTILKDGIASLSMRRIAAEIDYSPTAIYTYFKSKDEIIFCVCDEIFAQVAGLIAAAVDENNTPEENLKRCMLTYAKFGLENQDSYTIAFMTPRSEKSFFRFLESGTNGMRAYGTVLNIASQISGEPEAGVQVMWSSMHGIVSNLIQNRNFPWEQPDKLINLAIDTLIKGFTGSGK
ncbi:TetR/AcrR family transcriptional regulator [Seleniivibrio sp.]|uniref:TetR/AcrR family transcriptional regulator n=1 Tax=Seleniivibrio sp. TaxID=2898801 RepID=UPI0025E45243|nr:TetR/AcrR family transcriptional regulator [Seleniivibrio sp.]MCD8552685.1 TetR/AcrR family transcriptional regulator [Seleniivibrio sp.]